MLHIYLSLCCCTMLLQLANYVYQSEQPWILIITFLWFGRMGKMNRIDYFTCTLQPFTIKLKKGPHMGAFNYLQFLNEVCSEQVHFSLRVWHWQKQLDCFYYWTVFIAQPLWFTKKWNFHTVMCANSTHNTMMQKLSKYFNDPYPCGAFWGEILV